MIIAFRAPGAFDEFLKAQVGAGHTIGVSDGSVGQGGLVSECHGAGVGESQWRRGTQAHPPSGTIFKGCLVPLAHAGSTLMLETVVSR